MIRMPVVLAVLVALVGPSPALAAGKCPDTAVGCIVAITDPPLDLFEKAKVTIPLVSLEPPQVTLPIPILEIAPNKMMRVEVNGTTGWVLPTFVETDLAKPKAEFICDVATTTVQVGATRGLGKGCR